MFIKHCTLFMMTGTFLFLTWIRPYPNQPQLWTTGVRGLVPGWLGSHSLDPWTRRWPWWSSQYTEAPCLLEHQYSSCQWWLGCKGSEWQLQLPWKQKHQAISTTSVMFFKKVVVVFVFLLLTGCFQLPRLLWCYCLSLLRGFTFRLVSVCVRQHYCVAPYGCTLKNTPKWDY